MQFSQGMGDGAHVSRELAYREDIDRLRGLAVLSVVAFHFDVRGVYGGYVGVDIFFVISGFLITQIIQREMRAGSFSFAQFYERRIRRLLPALYVVVLASIVPAFWFLLPSQRLSLLRSIVAVVTFTSNILFWSQSGYFDRTAVEKPLLHTWSLAVEEQFYLVFPLLIWLLLRYGRRRAFIFPAALAAMLLASFGAGLWLMQRGDVATAFYMSPVRAWEFLIGSVMAVQGFPVLTTKWQRLLAAGGGYALLLASIFGLRPNSDFPGWNALYPCLGAALFIWSGTGAPVVIRHRFSPYRAGQFLGTISYSIYLWHWPLFVYVRLATDGLTLTSFDKVMLFAVTIALSTLSWAFVEQPLRRKRLLSIRRRAFTGMAVASLGVVAVAFIAMVVPTKNSGLDRTIARLDAYNSYDERAVYRGGCFRLNEQPIDQAQCMTMSRDRPNVLLWGDSHAAHYYPGLAVLAKNDGFNLMQATQAGCAPAITPRLEANRWCRDFADTTNRWFESHRPDLVILSGDWMGDVFSSRFDALIANIRASADALISHGAHVVVIGPAIQFNTGLPTLLIHALSRNPNGPLPLRDMIRPDIFAGDARMKAALPDTRDFTYVSVLDAVCPDQLCPALVDGDVPLTWDYGHLTTEGSIDVVGKLPLHLDRYRPVEALKRNEP